MESTAIFSALIIFATHVSKTHRIRFSPGRKKILRWREELAEDQPAPPPQLSTMEDRIKWRLRKGHGFKDIEKERAVRKPKRNCASYDVYNGEGVSGMELLYRTL